LEALEGTARELLAEAEADPNNTEDANDVASFLRGLLVDGPVGAKSIKADADGAGYSWDQVKRASLRIGVEKRKAGLKGGWVWSVGAEESMKGAKGAHKNSALSSPPSVLPSGGPVAADADVEVI
jgi:putative DNA primase/helicase